MIYFDHAATSPLHPEINRLYTGLLKDQFANSESTYDLGMKVSSNLEKSRAMLAQALGVKANDILFTSGASESNSMAIKSIAWAHQHKGKHIISTNSEHSSVSSSLAILQEHFDFEVSFLPVNSEGSITVNQVKEALRDDTILVSIMAINNEVGSINPIHEIGQLLKTHQAIYHVDAVQALGKMKLDFSVIDLCSLSAHKLGGLKGSGVLVKKHHIPLIPLISGGAQEFGERGGTSNALVHTLFYKTFKLFSEGSQDKVHFINQYLREELSQIENVVIHSVEGASPYILSFSCLGYTSELLANALNLKGIYVSYRSTCHNRDKVGSTTLKAMGKSEEELKSVLRLSFDHTNTIQEAQTFIKELKGILKQYGSR